MPPPPPQLVHPPPDVVTCIKAVQETAPLDPLKVPVKVVSEDGKMDKDPLETGVVEPTRGLTEPSVAFGEFHEMVTDSPVFIFDAERESVHAA